MLKAFLAVFRWLLSGAQIKFVIFSSVVALFALAIQLLVPLFQGFINPASLNSAFSAVNPTVWYFLNLTGALNGMGLVISAYISRFLIRRIPFIG